MMILFKFKIKSIGILIHYYILQNKMHAIFGDIVIPDFRHFDDGLSKNDAQIQGQKPDNFIDSLFNNENIDRKFNEFESDKQKNEEIHLMKDSKKKIKSMKRKNNPGKEKKIHQQKKQKKMKKCTLITLLTKCLVIMIIQSIQMMKMMNMMKSLFYLIKFLKRI